jgi:hypothetical protein
MAKATLGVQTFLLDFHFVFEKGHGDFALLRVPGYEGGHVSFNRGFANGFTYVRIAAAGHPFAIELHLQFVVAHRENAKVVAVVLVEAVDLSGRNGALSWPGTGSRLLCDSERAGCKQNQDDVKDSIHNSQNRAWFACGLPPDVRKASGFPADGFFNSLSAARLSLAAEKSKPTSVGKAEPFRTSGGGAVLANCAFLHLMHHCLPITSESNYGKST